MRRFFWLFMVSVVLSVGANAFPIRSYDTRMEIRPDSSVFVTERIVADFTGDPHHGIFREIPLSGRDKYGNKYRIRHDNLRVTDETGAPLTVKLTAKRGRVHIRIGDPDVLVDNVRTYIISYRLLRAIHFFPEHDELYWNPVGVEWEVPIEKATCVVTLPGDAAGNAIRTASYTGMYGSVTSSAGSDVPDNHTSRFWMTRPLSPGEAMTIVVGWPKGMVARPSFKQEAMWFVSDNAYFFLPPLFLLSVTGLWWKAGRDPDTGKSEMVTYDPPDGLRPAELGALIDERVDMRDIAASIVDLAVRGYIHIKVTEEKGFISVSRDYLLTLQKPYEAAISDMALTGFERAIIRALFASGVERWMSSLTNHFYIHLPGLRDELYDSLVKRGYFTHRPDSVRSSYLFAGIGVMGAGVLSLFFLSSGEPFVMPIGWSIAIILCGAILAIAARSMPRKTAKGKNVLLGARGFEEYLSRAERQDIETQERQNYFETFLPYAMAFGIAQKWARAFDGLQATPPQWYSGDTSSFRPSIFASDMSHASSNWGSAMSSPRSSGGGGGSGFSGGGSSGGGGGGGGGGGW